MQKFQRRKALLFSSPHDVILKDSCHHGARKKYVHLSANKTKSYLILRRPIVIVLGKISQRTVDLFSTFMIMAMPQAVITMLYKGAPTHNSFVIWCASLKCLPGQSLPDTNQIQIHWSWSHKITTHHSGVLSRSRRPHYNTLSLFLRCSMYG